VEDNSGSEVGCTLSGKKESCPTNQLTYPLDSKWTDPSVIPDPIMPTVASNTSACTGYATLCNGGSGDSTNGWSCSLTIPPSFQIDGKTPGGGPANFGKVNFGSCAKITLQPGVYNMDTLLISNGATIIVPTSGAVVINILNASGSTTPLNMNGGTVSNNGGDPLNLSFVYAGTNSVSINAGANTFATVYAPHANVTITGNGGIYGAIVGKNFSFTGSGHVVYDTSLSNRNVNFTLKGSPPTGTPYHVDQFSWNAF
jgi:Putative Ice-binding-like adhesive domain